MSPRRRRIGPLAVAAPDPEIFRYGDGMWKFFPDEQVYASREAARRAWNRPGVRRAVWDVTHCGRVPGAAVAYDGFSTAGYDTLLKTVWANRFALAKVMAGLDADRAAIAHFETTAPKAAAAIAPHLRLWRAYLDTVETVARRRAQLGQHVYGMTDALGRKQTYGEALAADAAGGRDDE